jgi:hypothetical protein
LALLLFISYLEAAAPTAAAAAGDKSAQEQLNYAARDGKLEFDSKTGRAYLEQRIAGGDKDAQEKLTPTSLDRVHSPIKK